jgi:hypothetical protein
MSPLIVYDVIIPSNHISNSITAIVQSMILFLFVSVAYGATTFTVNSTWVGSPVSGVPFT